MLRISFECPEDFGAMSPVDGGRHCAKCSATVIDLSHVTQRDALERLAKNERTGALECMRLAVDERGRTLFVPEPPPKVRRLPVLALTATMVATGCASRAQESVSVEAGAAPTVAASERDADLVEATDAGAAGAVQPVDAGTTLVDARHDAGIPAGKEGAGQKRKPFRHPMGLRFKIGDEGS